MDPRVGLERQNAQCGMGEAHEPGLTFQPHWKQLCLLVFVLYCYRKEDFCLREVF